jgi:hypothetical protein
MIMANDYFSHSQLHSLSAHINIYLYINNMYIFVAAVRENNIPVVILRNDKGVKQTEKVN